MNSPRRRRRQMAFELFHFYMIQLAGGCLVLDSSRSSCPELNEPSSFLYTSLFFLFSLSYFFGGTEAKSILLNIIDQAEQMSHEFFSGKTRRAFDSIFRFVSVRSATDRFQASRRVHMKSTEEWSIRVFYGCALVMVL